MLDSPVVDADEDEGEGNGFPYILHDFHDLFYEVAIKRNLDGIDEAISKMMELEKIVPYSTSFEAMSELVTFVYETWRLAISLHFSETHYSDTCAGGYLVTARNGGAESEILFECEDESFPLAMLYGLFEKLHEEACEG